MAKQLDQGTTSGVAAEATDDFAALLQKEFKPNTDSKRARIEEAVQTLAQQALADSQIIGEDVFATVDAIRAAIDAKLTEQINKVIHHPDFQAIESAWRSLSFSRRVE